MSRKTGSERRIENEFFKSKIGTIDKKKHDTFYIEGGTFITPRAKKRNYREEVSSIEKGLRKAIYSTLRNTPDLDVNYIFHLNVAEARLNPSKGVLMTFQALTRYRNGKTPGEFNDAAREVESFATDIMSQAKSIIEGVDFTVSKKAS